MKIRISSNGLSVSCCGLEYDKSAKIMYLLDENKRSIGTVDMFNKYFKFSFTDKDTKFYNIDDRE